MKLFEGYKNTLLVLITTIIFGYMLGLTISTVVDYRLRDAIINIPRPRNNIVVKLDDLKIKTNRVKEHFTSNKKGSDKKTSLNSYKSKKKPKKIIEKKTHKIIEKTQKNKKTQENNEEASIEKFTNLWDSDKIHDQALTMYSNNYNKNNKKIKNNKSFLNAANQEDTDQLYQSVNI